MHIYIDESGSFASSDKPNSGISCIGALVIPDNRVSRIILEFELLSKRITKDKGEVKGRLLQEAEIAKVIKMLSKFEVLFFVVCADMNKQTNTTITNNKIEQCKKITETLTNEHHERVVEQVWQLRKTLEGMTNQLYVQSVVVLELIKTTFEYATLYYSQRRPIELNGFHWRLDAKDKSITTYEKWWQSVMLPFLQYKSSMTPFSQFEKGCYKYFEQHFISDNETPKHLVELFGRKDKFHGILLNNIMRDDFQFIDSKDCLGIQIVDILVNSLRRAFNGNLQISGWSEIGKLMIYKPKETIRFISFENQPSKMNKSQLFVYKQIERMSKPMLLNQYYQEGKNDILS